MCSTFSHKTSLNSAYSKSQYEAPKKQLLQLRSQIKPLLSADSCYCSDTDAFSYSTSSPSPRRLDLPVPPKLFLQYIEKDRRVLTCSKRDRQMDLNPLQQYSAFDRPVHHSRKTAPPLMRTPSSGFSSSSSSENMLSALSLTNNDQKIREIMDPSVEVDLDMFLQPDVRYKQPLPVTSMSGSRGNMSTISGPSHSAATSASTRLLSSYQNKTVLPNPYTDFSYSNVKRSSGYTDFMPTISQPSSSSIPLSPSTWIKCQYCWETYVKLCQRVTSQEPLITCDGPWQWHSLYDAQGRVTCPRLWFTQLDRAGSDMIQQMGHNGVRHAPV